MNSRNMAKSTNFQESSLSTSGMVSGFNIYKNNFAAKIQGLQGDFTDLHKDVDDLNSLINRIVNKCISWIIIYLLVFI